LLDVGGGSVELVLVQQGRPLWLRSLPLGAARLAERFLTTDPPTKRQIQRLEKHLARELGSLLTSARHAGVVRVIGTSGTVNTLVAMAAAARGQDLPRLHGARATAHALREPGRRAAVPARAPPCARPNPHARAAARLAPALSDGAAAALGLPATARELLTHAPLLHDIGHAIDHNRHHHHSCYLIRNMELVAFDPLEIEIIAQVVRGHRKQVPKLADPEVQALPRAARRVVRGLAALLRTADPLDRTH